MEGQNFRMKMCVVCTLQVEEEFERERQELKEKAVEQQRQAVQREEELSNIIEQLKSDLAKVYSYFS